MSHSASLRHLEDAEVLKRSLAERRRMQPSLESRAEKRALALFHAAAVRVPAYRDFLKRSKIDHMRVKTMRDFAAVPTTDAKNYIASYPVAARTWDGKLPAAQFIATSSGTTGEPKYWPRSVEQDLEATIVHEFLYKEYFGAGRHTTLLLIGFPMGIYISGVATLLPSWLASPKIPGMTIMSIGNNKHEMLRAVRNLSHEYDQTVLIGHPFFIKDVIETGEQEGVVWAKTNLGLMFCSEGFTEEWRAYVAKKAGIKSSAMRIFNTYGSSEMLLMGYETRFSIGLKALTEKNPAALSALTGSSDIVPPQWFQYNPLFRYIESVGRELMFTSASGIPLIRFDLRDRGITVPFADARRAVAEHSKAGAASNDARPFPLVALWGRSDQTIKYYGVNIYPEHIKAGLMGNRLLNIATGKFVIRKFLAKGMDQRWGIDIELMHGIRPSAKLTREFRSHIVDALRKVNLEYLDMSTHIKKDVRPVVTLWPYAHEKYFKPGLKPRYIENRSDKK